MGPALGLRQCRVEGAKERGAGADQGTTGNFGHGHFHKLMLSELSWRYRNTKIQRRGLDDMWSVRNDK